MYFFFAFESFWNYACNMFILCSFITTSQRTWTLCVISNKESLKYGNEFVRVLHNHANIKCGNAYIAVSIVRLRPRSVGGADILEIFISIDCSIIFISHTRIWKTIYVMVQFDFSRKTRFQWGNKGRIKYLFIQGRNKFFFSTPASHISLTYSVGSKKYYNHSNNFVLDRNWIQNRIFILQLLAIISLQKYITILRVKHHDTAIYTAKQFACRDNLTSISFAGTVWRRGRGRRSSAGSDVRAGRAAPGPNAQRFSTRVGLHTSRGYW